MGLINLVKNYKKYGRKEFFRKIAESSSRMTPTQQDKSKMTGEVFILLGIILGIYMTFKSKTWWLVLILFGSLIVTSVTFLSSINQFQLHKRQDEIMRSFQNPTKIEARVFKWTKAK